jgi:tetratricopeptide (TPR) repeat protein
LSSFLTGKREFAEAEHILRELLTEYPERADVYALLASVLLNSVRPEEALLAYQQAIRLGAVDINVNLGRAAALSTLNRHREALEAFDLVLKMDPQVFEKHPETFECYENSRSAVNEDR